MRYSSAVLERIREPRFAGSLSPVNGDVGTGEAGSLESGTLIRMQVRIAGEQVTEAKFKAFGCSAAIASASFVAERLQGLTVADAGSIASRTVIDALDLPAERVHVASLAVEAARAAIEDLAEAKTSALRTESESLRFRTEGQGFNPGQDVKSEDDD